MIRKPSVLAILAILLMFSGGGGVFAAESRFFSALNDIPLMPGLYELTEETVVFDKPEGRIVESSAVSETEKAPEIRAFYGSVLPELGWNAQSGAEGVDSYLRQGEKLSLTLEARGQLNIVHFSLSPHP
ncbi:MAG: hypothetical protein ACXW4B_00275 [Micavibrio sp.]